MAVMETNELFKTQLSLKKHLLSPEEIEGLKKVSLEILVDIVSLCDENDIPYMLGGGTALGAVRHKGFIPWDDDIDINVQRKDIDKLTRLIKKEYGEKYELDIPIETKGYLSSFIQIHKKGTIFREFLSQDREHCGIKIDIFPIENTYSDPVRRKIHGIRCEAGLLILSCYRMFAWRKEFLELSKGVPKARAVILTKGIIGMLFAPCHDFWYKHIQKLLYKCRDDKTEYVVIPSGRKHFFGEIYKRKSYLETISVDFEGHKFKISKDYDGYLKNLYGDYMQIPPVEKREHHVLYELKF